MLKHRCLSDHPQKPQPYYFRARRKFIGRDYQRPFSIHRNQPTTDTHTDQTARHRYARVWKPLPMPEAQLQYSNLSPEGSAMGRSGTYCAQSLLSRISNNPAH